MQSIFKLGFGTNKASIVAFIAGVILLSAVLFIPGLGNLFQVADFTIAHIGWIVLLAFLPTVVIQIYKVIHDAVTSRNNRLDKTGGTA